MFAFIWEQHFANHIFCTCEEILKLLLFDLPLPKTHFRLFLSLNRCRVVIVFTFSYIF